MIPVSCNLTNEGPNCALIQLNDSARPAAAINAATQKPWACPPGAFLFWTPAPPSQTDRMDRTQSIALEFYRGYCSVVRGNLHGVECLTVARDGQTIMVFLGDPNSPEGRKAADAWQGQRCWCKDRTAAHAIADALESGEFGAN